MASKQSQRSNSSGRKRQGPLMPGSLILMLMFAALIVGMYVYPLTTAKSIEYSDLLKLVEGNSVTLEEYAREMILLEETHLDEVNKMLRKPGEIEPFSE